MLIAWFMGMALVGLGGQGQGQPPRVLQVPGIGGSVSADRPVSVTDRDMAIWLKKGTELTCRWHPGMPWRGRSHPRQATDLQPEDSGTVRYTEEKGPLVAQEVWPRSTSTSVQGQSSREGRGLFGALAYDRRTGAYGFSYDYASRAEARDRALQKCGPGCALVVEFANQCGAYATGEHAAEGWGMGLWRTEAESMALEACKSAGGNCQIQVWACTSRPGTATAIRQAKELSNRGARKADRQDYRGAIEDYNQALRLNPDFAEVYYNRGNARDGLQDGKGAIDDYTRAIRLKEDFAPAWANRGASRAKLNEWKGAIEDFTQAIRLKPQEALYHRNRGVSRGKHGDKPGAIEDLQKAADLARRQGNRAVYQEVAGAFYHLGRGQLGTLTRDENSQAAVWRDAIEYYDHAIRLRPDFAPAYAARGGARHLLDDHDGAIADYTQAIQLAPTAVSHSADWVLLRWEGRWLQIGPEPDTASYYYNRASPRARLGDWRGASEDLTQAIRLSPDHVEYYQRRGRIRGEAGDMQGALEDFTQVIQRTPNEAGAYEDRGGIRAAQGDKQRAIEDFQKAAALYQKRKESDEYERMQRTIRRLQQ
jgi:tetratricopeptide (TPR) repeat protein